MRNPSIKLLLIPFSVFVLADVSGESVNPDQTEPNSDSSIHGFWQHVLTLSDQPKYKAGFSHFSQVNPDAPKGGNVHFGLHGTFDSLNPYILKGLAPSKAPALFRYGVSELNEPLMTGTGRYAQAFDELDTAYGLIAEAVRINSDRTRLEFKLRKEARFHDGHPVSSADVAFSYKTFSKLSDGHFSTLLHQVRKVETPDPHHIIFHLAKDSSFTLPLQISELPVLPEHYWKSRDFNQSTLEPPLLSGPYRITQVISGKQLVFERVQNYWGKDLPVNKGMHNFDKITFHFFRDIHTLSEAFKSKKLDAYFEIRATNWATGYDFPAIRDGSIIRELIPFEMTSGQRVFVFNLRREELQDRRVRQAISLMFDWNWTSKAIFQHAYTRTTSYFPENITKSHSPPTAEELSILHPYEDILPTGVMTQGFKLHETTGSGDIREQRQKALTLLNAAGWHFKTGKTGKTGHLKKGTLVNTATGKEMKLQFIHYTSTLGRFILPFAKNLKSIGIELEYKQLDMSQYHRRLQHHDFDLVQYVYPIRHLPGAELISFFHSEQADNLDSRNLMGARNPVVDSLIDKIAHSENKKEILALSSALDRVLLWEHYAIPNWHGKYLRLAYQKSLKNSGNHPPFGFRLSAWWKSDE